MGRIFAFPGVKLEELPGTPVARDPIKSPRERDVWRCSRYTRSIERMFTAEPKPGELMGTFKWREWSRSRWKPGPGSGEPLAVIYRTVPEHGRGSARLVSWSQWKRWCEAAEWVHDGGWNQHLSKVRRLMHQRNAGASWLISWCPETGTGTWAWGEVRVAEAVAGHRAKRLRLVFDFLLPDGTSHLVRVAAPTRMTKLSGDGSRFRLKPHQSWTAQTVSHFAMGLLFGVPELAPLTHKLLTQRLEDADAMIKVPAGPRMQEGR